MSFQARKLGDLCDFQGGSQPPKSNFVYEPQDGYVRFLQIRDFGSEKNHTYIPVSKKNRICNSDDIMIGRYGASVGKILRGRSGAYNVALMKASPDTSVVDKQYFWHYLNSSIFQDDLKNVASRSAQDGFSKDDIFNFQVPLPPLATQQKIVAKLDAIFAEIDKATAATESIIKNAEVLFQSYLSGIFHSENPNFISKTIGEIGEIFSGSGFPVSQQVLINEEIPFYKVSDMNLAGNERHMISHNNSISRETAKQLGAKIIPAKSVIFPKIGGAIATNKKRILSMPSCVDNNVMAIYPNDNLVNPQFFFHLISSIELSSFANEAALPSIKKSTVEERLVKIPKSLSEQERICNLIESLKENSYKLKNSYLRKLNGISLFKQSILRQAFTGELVKE